MAPSDLPRPILVSHSMTDGISAYAGEFGGFKVEGVRVEEIFGGVNVRKRLAREGLYKGVDEDSGK
jgi:hypothetical protein